MNKSKLIEKKINNRTEEVFASYRQRIFVQTDRLFVALLLFQWLASIVVAYTVSPRMWTGYYSQIHPHLYAAIFLGGIITSFPVYLGIFQSGKPITRYVIASAQVLWSSLFIHLSGGRIETHFHVFGSLAFIAFYRDWKVLVPATIIVAFDHFLRGVYWPQSIFGIATASQWRWFEHSCWVLFEDVFLIHACRTSTNEMHEIANRTAQLEFTNEKIETEVKERTVELEESQKELKRAVHAKGEFLANMSHEIRTPLNGIIGFSSLLKSTKTDEKQKHYIKTIVQSGNILLKIINDILEFSKLEARKIELKRDSFNMPSLIEETLDIVRALANSKGIDLCFEIDRSLPTQYFGDSMRIKQVILNLVNNAVKFTDEGKVCVSLKRAEKNNDKLLSFTVSDTGVGIPKEKQNSIFEAFNQVDNSTTRRHSGTGLGLAIVREFVHLMNGSITLESIDGVGSKFTFILELDVDENQSVIPEHHEIDSLECNQNESKDKARILVAEDNRTNQELIQIYLENFGYEVVIVDDGKEAVKEMKKGGYSLCLMDIHMPVMNGYEATRLIRQNISTDIPIIALTASVMEKDKAKCFNAGMNDFIEKPIEISRIGEILNRYIQSGSQGKHSALR